MLPCCLPKRPGTKPSVKVAVKGCVGHLPVSNRKMLPGWTLPTLRVLSPGARPPSLPASLRLTTRAWQAGRVGPSFVVAPGAAGLAARPGPAHKEHCSRGSPCSPRLVLGWLLGVRGLVGARPRPPSLNGNPGVWQEGNQAGLAATGLWRAEGPERVCVCGRSMCANVSVCVRVCVHEDNGFRTFFG